MKAFIFGKFLPFHKGHQALIEFALESFEFLTVLVCCSDKEAIAPTVKINCLLFIDTDIYITHSYASFMCGKQLEVFHKKFNQSKATVYLYLNNDMPHVQDGTRLDEEERNKLDLSHRETLRSYGIDYHEIKGN